MCIFPIYYHHYNSLHIPHICLRRFDFFQFLQLSLRFFFLPLTRTLSSLHHCIWFCYYCCWSFIIVRFIVKQNCTLVFLNMIFPWLIETHSILSGSNEVNCNEKRNDNDDSTWNRCILHFGVFSRPTNELWLLSAFIKINANEQKWH